MHLNALIRTWVQLPTSPHNADPESESFQGLCVCARCWELKDGDSCEFLNKVKKERVESGSRVLTYFMNKVK